MRSAATFAGGLRMSRYSGRDDYLNPSSGVLRNSLGINDAARLEPAEAALVATRSYELSQTPLPGQFDLAHLHPDPDHTWRSRPYSLLTATKYKSVATHLADLLGDLLGVPGSVTPRVGPPLIALRVTGHH